MDKLVPRLYKEYGMYVNHSRAFPDSIDGLKPVERRVLLSAYSIAKDKLVKSARIDGTCLGKWHPHASSYSTICQMVKQGFLDGQGNFGNDIGVESSPPAAMRYTECKLNKNFYDIALKLVDHVDWIESELDNEPEYFPTMFPLCFLGSESTTGIGFGYKTLIPSYNIKDLKNRLLFLLGKIKDKPIIRPLTNCKFLSDDSDFEKLLTTGKATIKYQGIFKLEPSKCKAIIKSLPPGKKFDTTILGKFDKELTNQDIGWIDESSADNNGTHIVFEVLKSRNRDQIFKSFSKKLSDVMTSTVTFDTIVVDHDTKNVKNISIDEMLVNTFKTYLSVNMRMLKTNESKINESILEVKTLGQIKPSLKKYISKPEYSVDEIIGFISEETKINIQTIKELLQKYRITKLLTVKVDIDELNEKLKTVKHNINNIENFVVGQYEGI